MSQRVIITPDENGNNPTVIADLSQNQNMLPVNVSYHETNTNQQVNAVSIPTVSYSVPSGWLDTIGFTDISVSALWDASTVGQVDLRWSNDGTTQHGSETVCVSSSATYRVGTTKIKARYVKVCPYNGDTISHTVSAWAYLLA